MRILDPLAVTVVTILAATLTSIVIEAKVVEDQEDSVTIKVYYESMCPTSIYFITAQLMPAWNLFGDQLNIQLRPFGKANWTESGNSWEFECQHGPDECQGNLVHACILFQLPAPRDHLPLIDCLLTLNSTPQPVGACLAEIGMEWLTADEVLQCSEGDMGRELLHSLGKETHSLEPPLTALPWILFNNEYLAEDMPGALNDLIGLLCDRFLQDSIVCGQF